MAKMSKFEQVSRIMSTLFSPERHVTGLAIIHGEDDLWALVNSHLPLEERITSQAYYNYRKGIRGRTEDDEIIKAFQDGLRIALAQQKESLFEKMEEEGAGAWQKYAWIIERKFKEWNLKQITVDETPDIGRLVFKVKDANVISETTDDDCVSSEED
jgi:hypothetical protein